jgi:hypothetical protein
MKGSMAEKIPPDIEADLERAAILHQRAASDYDQCQAFNKLMAEILARLEDAGCDRAADRVMGILIDCNPRQGAQCEKATRIGDKMKKFRR